MIKTLTSLLNTLFVGSLLEWPSVGNVGKCDAHNGALKKKIVILMIHINFVLVQREQEL